jgi:hypothetical protein
MAADKQSLTRRTLHYYWLVTKKHLGFFIALMFSDIAFVALLTYGNPLIMSLIVDRVSASPVAADQVFNVFGPYIIALISGQPLRAGGKQAPGLHALQARDRRQLRPCADVLRCAR